MIDVIKVLKREDKCYQLEDKSVFLAGELLEMTGKAKKGKGEELARNILDSGKAFKKFQQIIKAQGGNIHFNKLQPAKFQKDVHAKKSGRIKDINNKKINALARIAGCPVDKFAGLHIHSHVGDSVKKHGPIITIYSENRSRLNQAVAFYHTENPIKI